MQILLHTYLEGRGPAGLLAAVRLVRLWLEAEPHEVSVTPWLHDPAHRRHDRGLPSLARQLSGLDFGRLLPSVRAL